jgi:3-methyladenine DNA glycosylase AlkC
MSASALEHQLRTALDADNLDSVLAALEAAAQPLDAKGQQFVKAESYLKGAQQALAARLILAHWSEHPDELHKWVKTLAAHTHPSVRGIGAMMLPDLYPHRRRLAVAQLMRLADDENWTTREAAGSAAGNILNSQFDEFYPVLEAWAQHPSENVRRAVVLATMHGFDRRHPQPDRAEPLLRLHDVLVTDHAEYVRVNLGPFAIGAMILRHYPEPTLKRLRKWARLKSEAARWNVAMVWTAAGARGYAEDGVQLITQLASDERRFVWRAAASAMVKLARTHPDVCRPIIAAWADDPERRQVADTVRKYLQ